MIFLDISIIKADQTNTTTGIKIGHDDAPVKVIEFMNLRCPFCLQWFEESEETLNKYVENGTVQRIVKLFDKEKDSLRRGNVMHHHIPTDSGEVALAAIKKIFEHQNEWGPLSLVEVDQYADKVLGFPFNQNPVVTAAVIEEARHANIQFVPTVIINEHIFDENISQAELIEIIEEAAKK